MIQTLLAMSKISYIICHHVSTNVAITWFVHPLPHIYVRALLAIYLSHCPLSTYLCSKSKCLCVTNDLPKSKGWSLSHISYVKSKCSVWVAVITSLSYKLAGHMQSVAVTHNMEWSSRFPRPSRSRDGGTNDGFRHGHEATREKDVWKIHIMCARMRACVYGDNGGL